VFGALRKSLVEQFGDIGRMCRVIPDFEQAAINAVGEVFPKVSIKGCTFHFRQAIICRVNHEGLQAAYNGNGEPEIREWIRQLMALSLLPAFAITHAWQFLRVPPVTADPSTAAKDPGAPRLLRADVDRWIVSREPVESLRHRRTTDRAPRTWPRVG
jgi:hypothetical protein